MNGRFLFDYYRTNEVLMTIHNWNPEYTDNLIPYEKDLYFKLLTSRLNAAQQKDQEYPS